MLITHSPTTGKKIKMPDIVHCFLFYPQFEVDFRVLIDNGVIKHIAFDQYEWTKSKTSLAEYFKSIGNKSTDTPGGFWAPIEKVFKINRRTLSKLASGNANPLKPEESKDFKKIKELVIPYREEVRQQEEEADRLRLEEAKLREDFQAIKEFIKNSKNADIETLRKIKEKIKNILA
jgi:hypothetical protein